MPSACSTSSSPTRRVCAQKVLACAVFSPLDLERENPNLIGGDSLSGSHHLDQNFFLRPVPGWSRYRTPVTQSLPLRRLDLARRGHGAGSGSCWRRCSRVEAKICQ